MRAVELLLKELFDEHGQFIERSVRDYAKDPDLSGGGKLAGDQRVRDHQSSRRQTLFPAASACIVKTESIGIETGSDQNRMRPAQEFRPARHDSDKCVGRRAYLSLQRFGHRT